MGRLNAADNDVLADPAVAEYDNAPRITPTKRLLRPHQGRRRLLNAGNLRRLLIDVAVPIQASDKALAL